MIVLTHVYIICIVTTDLTHNNIYRYSAVPMKGLCSVTSINTQAAFAGEMECCSIMIDQWCVGI